MKFICSLALILCFYDCQSIEKRWILYNSSVSSTKIKTIKAKKINRIGINIFEAKPSNFASFNSENFTYNLLFYLSKREWLAFVKEIKSKNTHIPNPKTSESTSSFEKSLLSNSIKPLNANQDQKSIEPSRESIIESCKDIKCDIFLSGYVYEIKTGDLLEEESTTGILVHIYSSNGEMIGQIQLISKAPMEIFDFNSKMASKIDDELYSMYGEKLINEDTILDKLKNWTN